MGVGLILPGAGGGGGGGTPTQVTAVAETPYPDLDGEGLLLDDIIRSTFGFQNITPWTFADPDDLVTADIDGNYMIEDAAIGLYILTFHFAGEPIDELSQYGLSARLSISDVEDQVLNVEGYEYHHQDIGGSLSLSYWSPVVQTLYLYASLTYNAGTGDGWFVSGTLTIQQITWG